MKRMKLGFEQLEARENPATVDLTGGVLTFTGGAGEANSLIVTVANGRINLNDASGVSIAFTGDATAANGWYGDGTRTATGPADGFTHLVVDLGDGDDVFNLRVCPTPVDVVAAESVNISSNAPTNTGSLAGIGGDVDVSGATTLYVSDQGAASGNAAVVIGANSITGFAGASDGVVITFDSLGTLRVTGSNSVGETFTVDSPAAGNFVLNTLGGAMVGGNAARVDEQVPEGDEQTNTAADPVIRSGLTGASAADFASGSVSLGWSIADGTDDHSDIILLDAAATPISGNITGVEATIKADANRVLPGSFLTVTTDA